MYKSLYDIARNCRQAKTFSKNMIIKFYLFHLFSCEILEMDVICSGHNLLKSFEVLVIRLQRKPKGHQYDDDQ